MTPKTIVLPLVALAFFACRKERSCVCEITTKGRVSTHTVTLGFDPIIPGVDTTTNSDYYNTTNSVTKYKLGKRKMRENCATYSEEEINESSAQTSPGIFTITTVDRGTRTSECEIVK